MSRQVIVDVIYKGFCRVFSSFFADVLPRQSEKFGNCLRILLLTYLAPEFRRLFVASEYTVFQGISQFDWVS